MGKSVDISGQKFNRLTAIERVRKEKGKGWIWRCVCDCGNEVFTTVGCLRSNNTKSCGCLNIEKIQQRNMAKRRYTFNLDYFNHMTPNLAYILGFFASDGTMIHGDWKIKFNVSPKDVDILEKIAKEISFSGEIKDEKSKIKEQEYDVKSLTITSKELYRKFEEFGFTNNKTLNVGIPECIPNEYIIHFIRGFFDGDGTVGGQYIKGSHQIRVRIGCGSEKIITQIRDWLHTNLGLKNVSINTDTRKRHWYEISYSTNDSLKLYEAFYKDDSIYLNRKKEKFEELIQLRNTKQKK